MARIPKKTAISVRLAPHLLDAVRKSGVGTTEAIEEALAVWLRMRARRERRAAATRVWRDAEARRLGRRSDADE